MDSSMTTADDREQLLAARSDMEMILHHHRKAGEEMQEIAKRYLSETNIYLKPQVDGDIPPMSPDYAECTRMLKGRKLLIQMRKEDGTVLPAEPDDLCLEAASHIERLWLQFMLAERRAEAYRREIQKMVESVSRGARSTRE